MPDKLIFQQGLSIIDSIGVWIAATLEIMKLYMYHISETKAKYEFLVMAIDSATKPVKRLVPRRIRRRSICRKNLETAYSGL